MDSWGFYGRSAELKQLEAILRRRRWFFVKITGRRRIGKTTLIQRALQAAETELVFYAQIPDSGPAGVLSAFSDAMDTFEIPHTKHARPTTLSELAATVTTLVRAGYVVALDEFQYFNRSRLSDFPSLLQAQVDALSSNASSVPGGLLVLGSIHTEMSRLLEDRSAPLFNRTTDELALTHLDISSVVEMLNAHSEATPERLLFLWNLFEGVPKFYRDCFEQGVLGAQRKELLTRAFFRSSSPLQTEADNWFLKELHGRYDVALKYIARNPGCSNGELLAHVSSVSGEKQEQVGGYLKILMDRFGLIERKQPIFSKPNARRGRYYITDNFLRSWLAALANQVVALNFAPLEKLVAKSDEFLKAAEGVGLEKLVAVLYEERSRKELGDFSLTSRVEGYWDKHETELDLVALDEDSETIRIGSCKRNAAKLLSDLPAYDRHIERFLEHHRRFRNWKLEKYAIAPRIEASATAEFQARGYVPQDLAQLLAPLS